MSKIKKMDEGHLEEMLAVTSYAFQWELSERNRRRFAHLAQHSWSYGSFDEEDKLASQVMATPFTVDFWGTSYTMAGVGFVASLPEYRKQGRIDAIMKALLQDCREQGITLSYLAPFSYPFYRRYGYELVFEQLAQQADVGSWADRSPRTGTVKRLPWHEAKPLIHEVYQQTAAATRGGLKREGWWEDYKFDLRRDYQYAIYFDEAQRAAGYLVYQLQGPIFELQEWGYTSFEAFKELQQFVAGHQGSVEEIHYTRPYSGSPQEIFQTSPEDKVQLKPYMMARIIDLESFLKDYPVREAGSMGFAIEIKDDRYCPWNDGLYAFDPVTGTFSKVTKTDFPIVTGSIQSFTQVLMGYKAVNEAAFYKDLAGPAEALVVLAGIVPVEGPMLADYF